MALKRLSEMEDVSGLTYEKDYPNITGYKAIDKDGKDIGEVRDLLVNTDNSIADRAIIGHGWLATLFGAKQIIVPFDRITVNPSDKTVRLDVARSELSEFPTWAGVEEENLYGRVTSWWRERDKVA